MAVPVEGFDVNVFVWLPTVCDLVRLRRNPVGDWIVFIDVDLEVNLDDGRTVRFVGEVGLKWRQNGHLLRANPLGRNSK